MKSSFLGICCCAILALCAGNVRAALQLQGISSYEVLSKEQKRVALIQEEFSALVEDKHWLIETKLVSSDPPMNGPQIFCPVTQTAGSEGLDSYYLKAMPARTNPASHVLIGWVEPGSVPDMSQSLSACIIWLAYCSGAYFGAEQPHELKPLWIMDANKNRQGHCMLPVEFGNDPASHAYPDWLRFLSDGRIDPCNTNRAGNVWTEPWSNGFTQAVFRVENFVQIGNLGKIPSNSVFEVFAPQDNPPRTYVRMRIRGTLTNAVAASTPASWMPEIPPGQRIAVNDYRFTDKVTNWTKVAYAMTNNWAGRGSSNLAAAVKTDLDTAPRSKRSARANRKAIAGALLILLFSIPLILIMRTFRQTKSKKGETA